MRGECLQRYFALLQDTQQTAYVSATNLTIDSHFVYSVGDVAVLF